MKNALTTLYFLFPLLLFLQTVAIGQRDTSWTLTGAPAATDLPTFLREAERQFPVRFYYDPADVAGVRLQPAAGTVSLLQYLRDNLREQAVYVSADAEGNVFLTRERPLQTALTPTVYPYTVHVDTGVTAAPASTATRDDFLNTEKEYVEKEIIIGTRTEGLGHRRATLSGYLYDAETREPIIGGALLVEGLNGVGTASDERGFYSLTLEKGKYAILISYLNTEERRVKIDLRSGGRQDFYLVPQAVTIEEVIVRSDKFNQLENTRMGFERLTTKSIRDIPLVLGERDIIKVATLLPGIQTVGEGTAGFNVRGAPADQNLFYIDEVPVYNTSHLFGFFSAFNSEAISEFSLAKSNIPAEYGGRLASIFDITALEGDAERYQVRGGISPITANVLFEGPIQRDKSSAMLGLRSTYSNWILNLIKNQDFKNTKVFFGDAIAKVAFKVGERNKISAFGYYSLDDINFAGTTQYDIENRGASLTWSRFFTEKHNMEVSLVYSRMGQTVENYASRIDAYRQDNALEHREAKVKVTLRPNERHDITLGGNAILYGLDRGNFLPAGGESQVQGVELGEEQGLEAGVFAADEWEITDDLALTAGLRLNAYSYLGPQEVIQYVPGQAKSPETILDTLRYGKNEAIKTYTGLDYRIGARYNFDPFWSVKASYNRLHQYIFLLSNTIALAPADKWKLTDAHIRPMLGDQWAVGVYSTRPRSRLELSLEAYYKLVDNLVEFRDGADLLVNESPEQDVLQGSLRTYGVELMVRKPEGRVNGWVNYTYSRSTAQVDTGVEGERINFGRSYPSNYDKPHNLNLVVNYNVIRRFSMSANVVYATGRPVTYPTSFYFQNEIPLVSFTGRNEYRLPDYLRLDLSARFEGNLKARKLLHGNLVFSVYNVLGRRNAYNVYFQANDFYLKGYKVSIFAHPIFSVTYNFKFGSYED